MKHLKLLFLLIFSLSTFSAEVELLARANNYNSFNLPDISILSNATIKNNSRGDSAFNFLVVQDSGVHQAIWLKNSHYPLGQMVHVADEGNYMSDPSLNEYGDMVFSVYNEMEVVGLYLYKHDTNQIKEIIDPKSKRFFSLRDPIINEEGTILFRLTFINGERTVATFKNGELNIIVSDKEEGVAYLFKPSFINQNEVALKVREGDSLSESSGDTIRVYKRNGEFIRVNSDADYNSASIFTEFNNALGTHHTSKYIAYIATLKNGQKALVRQIDDEVEIVVSEGMEEVSRLEYFTPAVNKNGHIAFRAIKKNGKRAIYYFDGNSVSSVLSEGDLVFTDVSTAVIHMPEGPAFGGGVAINNANEIVVNGRVYTKYLDQALGTAVLKITP